jgi:hypothetical protein
VRRRTADGERVLAGAATPDGEVRGTREALHLPDGTRLPWESVQAADWDAEAGALRVTAVAGWGEAPPTVVLHPERPDRLLQLVRERVTATVVLQRHTPITGTAGVRVIGRRAPAGERGLSWFLEYDEGLDPADPFVDQAAQEALAAARDEVGDR